MFIDDKKKQIITAAIKVFGNYGYKKTSMQDIADEMDISRPALYQYYKNKEAIFLALIEYILCLGEQAADAGFAKHENSFEALLTGILEMERVLFEPVFMTPKGKDLLLLSKSLAPILMADFEKKFLHKIIAQLDHAHVNQEIDLISINLDSSEVAQLILLAIDGIKHNSENQAMLDKQTQSFLRIFWRGLQSKGG